MSTYWFAGLTCDHLYGDCPSRVRAEAALRGCGWWDLHGEGLDPLGTDVCGLCRHRWEAKQKAGSALIAEVESHVLGVLVPEALHRWWDLPLPRLGDATARELIAAGRGDELLAYVRTYSDESFS